MSGFLIWAALLLLAAAAALCLPLLRRQPEGATPPARWLALGLGLALTGLGAALYPLLSNYSWQAAQARSARAEHAGIPALLEATRAQPGSGQAWIRLGAAWTQLQAWSDARAAFEQAVKVSARQDSTALAGLGQVQVLGGDGQISASALGLFEEALRIDATSPQALFYSGLAYLQEGRAADARARFVTMLALNPPPNVRDVLQKQVAELDEQLAAQAVAAASGISLRLSLSPSLAGRVPTGASLFVFVPAPAGGPPLAAKRLSAQLPQQVSLSAADSMLPGHSFKAGDTVKVVARLSQGGSPVGAPGDLYGEIQARAGEGGAHSLVIDREVPAK